MSAEEQLGSFIAKFAPENRALIRACRERMRTRFPDACELVYDNYNFLVIAYAATPKPSHASLSLAADRHGVTLCLLVPDAPALVDPTGILRGSGKRSRTVRLSGASDLDRADVVDVMRQAAALAVVPLIEDSAVEVVEATATPDGPAEKVDTAHAHAASEQRGHRLIIQSVSPTQRPRG